MRISPLLKWSCCSSRSANVACDGGFWFGYRRHAAHHGYVDHGREYRRVERELIEKRTRLLNRTRHALEEEEFEQTQRRLGRLMAADQELREHREGHRHCHH